MCSFDQRGRGFSAIFIRRPVATLLLTLAIGLAGAASFGSLPVASIPSVDLPTLRVRAELPGASPETMAATVAAPLERRLGRIADVTQMTSQSRSGTTDITLQFGLGRGSNGAARDVQAAINNARADLPAPMPAAPHYSIFNPADAPILILALTSATLAPEQIFDRAATVLQQVLSQSPGVGNVTLGGSSLPAVRVELNPRALFHAGVGIESVRAAVLSANANAPKGAIDSGGVAWQIETNDQSTRAADYRDLVIAYRGGAAIRLSDVAQVIDGVEDTRNLGLTNGRPAILLLVYKQPGGNVVATVDGVKAMLPRLQALLPGDVTVTMAGDASLAIRAALRETERTLMLSTALVILVVAAFLRDIRLAVIPCVIIPVSLLGTFAIMRVLGYSLDNLSLMALTIAAGFVVDDGVVVLENTARYVEAGMQPVPAAILAAREVGFTVVAMTLSLLSVFLPVLLMGGVVGRFLLEFAVVVAVAVALSLALALTAAPMLCAMLMRPVAAAQHWLPRLQERGFSALQRGYGTTLAWCLRHRRTVGGSLLAAVALNAALYALMPKTLFPQQDTGLLLTFIQGDESVSFKSMRSKLQAVEAIMLQDPDVADAVGYTGGRNTDSAFLFVSLKPLHQRGSPITAVMDRLRPQLARLAGAQVFMSPAQDLVIGARQSPAQIQYSLQADSTADLALWSRRLADALRRSPTLVDVSSDRHEGGLQSRVTVDRGTVARLGLAMASIDETLYDSFGQRQVSTIYRPNGQYHVVMELAPQDMDAPQALAGLYVSTAGQPATGASITNAAAGTVTAGTTAAPADDPARNAAINAIATTGHGDAPSGAAISTSRETMVPLSAVARFGVGTGVMQVNHEGQAESTTLAFNLAHGYTLADAATAVRVAEAEIRMPASVHGSFAGAAGTFQSELSREPALIAAAMVAVYLVLGVLYEDLLHPVTVLSTLPAAGLGAMLALIVSGTAFSLIVLVGILLLIGIVQKNAILMIDFALRAERERGLSPEDAIVEACLLRLRPILMTTAASVLGALPLALGTGAGAELRQPLGIAIVGGLTVSLFLTLYTTPVTYLAVDRWRRR